MPNKTPNAPLKIGINGFGRIGRLVLRAAFEWPELQFVQLTIRPGMPPPLPIYSTMIPCTVAGHTAPAPLTAASPLANNTLPVAAIPPLPTLTGPPAILCRMLWSYAQNATGSLLSPRSTASGGERPGERARGTQPRYGG